MRGGLIIVLLLLASSALARDPASPWWPESGGIIGRVFYDNDGDGAWSNGDEGLEGVVILTDTGELVRTDASGRYHIFVLSTGNEVLGAHLLKVDTTTLPSAAEPVDSPRRIVHLSPMQTARVDIAVRPPEEKTPSERGIEPPGRDVPPVLRPGDGGLVTRLAGKTRPGCQVAIDGMPAELENGTYQVDVTVRPGVNPHLIQVHCEDGHLEWLLAEIHWVERAKGGDLVIPVPPRSLAACVGPPPGSIPRAPAANLTCRVEAGVDLTLADVRAPWPAENARTIRLTVPLRPGVNTVPIRIDYGEAQALVAGLVWDVSSVRVTGAVLGVLGLSYGDGAAVFGGSLRGHMRADLPADLKLILGGSFESNGNKEIKDAFIPAWNPWRHRRDPDPESSFLVTGDESQVLDDNPAGSRYLLRLERKRSYLGWGSFETHNGENTETGTYRRALQGAHGVIRPLEDALPGPDPVFDLTLEGFYAPESPETQAMGSLRPTNPGAVRQAPSHEEFLATGGTLYFTGHRWVVEGSERIQVHERDLRTGLTLGRRTLRSGIDYQVDWTSGRILLTDPVDASIMGEGAVRLMPTGATATVLVVDYEYVDVERPGLGQEVAGGRAAATVRPARGVQITAAFEAAAELGDSDYSLLKGTARARFGKRGTIWAGYGSSSGISLRPAYSVDGGISFAGSPVPDQGEGEALEAGASVDFPIIQAQAMFRRWIAGYADTSLVADRDLTQALLLVRSNPLESLELSGRFSGSEQGPDGHPEAGTLLEGSLEARYRVLDALSLTAGGAFDHGDGGFAGDGHRAVAGLRATYRVVDWLALTAAHQHTLVFDGEGPASRNVTLSSAGAQVALGDRLHVGLEGGWGPDLGNIIRLTAREDREDGGATFAHTTFSVDHDALGAGSLSSGQAVPAGGGMVLTTSQTWAADRYARTRGQQVGLVAPLGDPWVVRLAYTRAELESPADPGRRRDLFPGPFWDRGLAGLTLPGRRNAIHARVAYAGSALALSAGGELRVDEHLPLAGADSDTLTTHKQSVLRLAGRWRVSDGATVGWRLAWAETFGMPNGHGGPGLSEGDFLEGSLGIALRFGGLDWFRFLARVAAGQGDRPAVPLEARIGWHRSQWLVGTATLLFLPTRYFQPSLVVAPFLYKMGHTGRNEAVNPVANGLVGLIRVGSEVYAGLGLSGELRLMGLSTDDEAIPDLGETGWNLGAAVELFYLLESAEIGGVRLGVGYSFSDIPDPLLNSDLRSGNQGLFVRLEGIY